MGHQGNKINYRTQLAISPLGDVVDQDTFARETGIDNIEYSNAGGYGFWVSKKAAKIKKAAGVPPLGANRAAKVRAKTALKNAQAKATTADDNSAAIIAAANTPSAAKKTTVKKDNNLLYVGIGGGLLLLVGGFFLLKARMGKKS